MSKLKRTPESLRKKRKSHSGSIKPSSKKKKFISKENLSDEVYEMANVSKTNYIIADYLFSKKKKKKFWCTLTSDYLFLFTSDRVCEWFCL